MKTDDFSYFLPLERIAQRPADPRDSSRLLIVERETGELSHSVFHELPDLLLPSDVLVLNETRVIPARLQARKSQTGGRVEILLLNQRDPYTWEALVGGRRVRPGLKLNLDGNLNAEIIADLGRSKRLVQFDKDVLDVLERIGEMPLPPYIHEPLRTMDEYQTTYARVAGSAAAPTAGLHFTPGLLQKIRRLGVRIATVTLHVGLDTFAPVTEEDPREHHIHTEWCSLSAETAALLNSARADNGRIIAVGTTSTRVLETAGQLSDVPRQIQPYEGPTNLFILPGFEFRMIDGLITNFHLPRSTLLMLVSAFAGRENILNTYQTAVDLEYRFYSFGDAMFIL